MQMKWGVIWRAAQEAVQETSVTLCKMLTQVPHICIKQLYSTKAIYCNFILNFVKKGSRFPFWEASIVHKKNKKQTQPDLWKNVGMTESLHYWLLPFT